MLSNVLSEVKQGCDLFGDQLLDRRTSCRRRERRIDSGDLALDVRDDLLFCGRQQCCEARADGALAISDISAVCGARDIAFGALEAAQRERCGNVDQLIGFAGFKGRLAQPFQGSRYWSRSQPLPRSRSFQ